MAIDLIDTVMLTGASFDDWESTHTTVQSTSSTWGGGGSGEAVTKSITQVAHGFSVGDVLYDNAGTWAKAQADTAAKAEVIGMVSSTTTNAFDLTTHGYVSGLTGLSADQMYFLDASTAGAITATEPSTTGQVSKPVFWSVSTTAGYVINYRGLVIPSPATTGGQVSIRINNPTVGVAGYHRLPKSYTIDAAVIHASASCSAVVDVWSDAVSTDPITDVTDADSITASAQPTLSSATYSRDATLTGWTTSLVDSEWIAFNVDSVSGAPDWIEVILETTAI